MFHWQGNGPDANTMAPSFEMASGYQFTSENTLVTVRFITESRRQILQLAKYLHFERSLPAALGEFSDDGTSLIH